MWLWGELDRSWYKYCGIRCFSCDDRFIFGNKALCLCFSRREAKGKLSGHCAGGVHVIFDVDLRWLYGAGPGRLKREGFAGRQSSLSHGESQTLNCLLWKLDFYPLRLGSGFPRSTEALLEKHAALWGHEKLEAQTSSSSRWPLTFQDQPHYWSHTRAAFLRVFVCLQALSQLQVSSSWRGPAPASTLPGANDDHHRGGQRSVCLHWDKQTWTPLQCVIYMAI